MRRQIVTSIGKNEAVDDTLVAEVVSLVMELLEQREAGNDTRISCANSVLVTMIVDLERRNPGDRIDFEKHHRSIARDLRMAREIVEGK